MSPTLYGIVRVTNFAGSQFYARQRLRIIEHFRAKHDNKSPWDYLGVNRNEHNTILYRQYYTEITPKNKEGMFMCTVNDSPIHFI